VAIPLLRYIAEEEYGNSSRSPTGRSRHAVVTNVIKQRARKGKPKGRHRWLSTDVESFHGEINGVEGEDWQDSEVGKHNIGQYKGPRLASRDGPEEIFFARMGASAHPCVTSFFFLLSSFFLLLASRRNGFEGGVPWDFVPLKYFNTHLAARA
jgi:hypothetical protein